MKNFTYKKALKYLFCAFLFYLANNISPGVPLSLSLLPAFMGIGFSKIAVSVIFCLISFLSFPVENSFYLIFSALFLCIIYSLYKAKKAKPKGEVFIYIAIALVPYFATVFNQSIYTKLVYSAIIIAFTLIFSLALNVIFIGRFKRKNKGIEQLSFYLFIIIFSLGFIETFGIEIYKVVALITMLFLCRFFKSPKAFIPAFILPIAISLYTQSFYYLALFEIYCAVILAFINYSPLLSAVALILAQSAICYFSGELMAFTSIDYLYTFLPSVIYTFIPQKQVEKLKNFILRFEEKEITREIINVERAHLSVKLNDLSNVFCDMEKLLKAFDQAFLTEETLCEKIADEVAISVCSECAFFADCTRKNHPKRKDLLKLISVGISKGKVSLIDLSKDFSSYCFSVNSMIFEINRLISLFIEQTQKTKEIIRYKDLISLQAGGLAQVLRSLAVEYSSRVDFKQVKENKIFDLLASEGFLAKQIICVGEDCHILFGKEKIVFSEVAKVLSRAFNKSMRLQKKSDVGSGILAVFSKCPLMDASFGVAQVPKAGFAVSGDSHTLTKINEGQFIVSLCDGMGSGANAHNNSVTAISLLETLYRSGLNRQSVLELVNKILSICQEDSFSTLDCAVFDLYTGKCDLIKIGATYGFLVTASGVKIIENTSLPLGILEEVSPDLSTHTLSDGDMVVIMSDGVSDAFFSSTDTIDFLQSENTRNPQTLANKLINYALQKYDGEAKDDMTAIVVKVYVKNSYEQN